MAILPHWDKKHLILRKALPQLHNCHTRFFYSERLGFNNTDTRLLHL